MATMYKRVNGNWVASAPHIYGDAEIVPTVSTVSRMRILYYSPEYRYQTSGATGPHLNTIRINLYPRSTIKIGYNSSVPLTFFYGTSVSRNQPVYLILSSEITTETINGITYYTFTLPTSTYLFICQSSGNEYNGVTPSSIVIKGNDKQWNNGDVYKSANNIWS